LKIIVTMTSEMLFEYLLRSSALFLFIVLSLSLQNHEQYAVLEVRKNKIDVIKINNFGGTVVVGLGPLVCKSRSSSPYFTLIGGTL